MKVKALALEDLYSKPAHLIRRAHQISWALFLDECNEFNLTPVQYAALVALQAYEGTDATRLSSLIAFDRATIGNVLERLEKRGLIRREAGTEDKRQKLLFLTKAGKKILEDVTPAVDRVQARILAPLCEDERQMMVALLTKMTLSNNEVTSAPIRRPIQE